jgi:hypothetical protein
MKKPEDAPSGILNSEFARSPLEAAHRIGTPQQSARPPAARVPNATRSALRKPGYNCQSESQTTDRKQYVRDVSACIALGLPQQSRHSAPDPYKGMLRLHEKQG